MEAGWEGLPEVLGLLQAVVKGWREQFHRQQPLAVGSPRLGCRSSLRRPRAAWSCAAAAGRAQSNGRPRRHAGVMTQTSTRQAAPEPFIPVGCVIAFMQLVG